MSRQTVIRDSRVNGYSRLLQAAETLYLWQQRARDRRRLAELDDRLLKDIGLNRARAAAEATKPFWQA